jgi:hypothetical protein
MEYRAHRVDRHLRQLLADSCKTFLYGARQASHSSPRVVDMGELLPGGLARFPDSISGTTSRPMQRANPLTASNLFQVGN